MSKSNMQRRSAIKSVGSGIVFGLIPTVSASGEKSKKIGVDEFENYTKELYHEHKGIKETGVAAQANAKNENQVKVKTQGNIEQKQDISILYDSDLEFGSVEDIEFGDGQTIRQVVKSKDGEIVEITVDGQVFKIPLEEIERTLSKRKRKVKLENERARRQMRRERQSERKKSQQNLVTPASDSSDLTEDGFEGGDTNILSTPATGDTYADVSEDHAQAAAEAAALGHGGVISQAYQSWNLGSGDLSVEFEGDYSVSWINATATSFIELRFFVEDSGGELSDTHAYNNSTFIADIGTRHNDYTEGIYISDIDSGYHNFVMEAEAGATAIGYTSSTAISAATSPNGNFNGDFHLDEWTIADFFDLV